MPLPDVVDTLQANAVANGNGAIVTTDGWETIEVLISNGVGTCTVTVQGSLDPYFTTAQDIFTLGLVKLSDSGAGVNTARAIVSGAVPVAANTSYLYALYDVLPYTRAVISGAAGLGAGASETGCTVKLYKVQEA